MRLGYYLITFLFFVSSVLAQDNTGLNAYLKLSGSNQSRWSPTTTLVPNLNADLCDSIDCSTFLTSEVDPLSIHKDGTSITTAKIPFAEGLSTGVGSTKGIDIGSAGSIYDSSIPGDDRLYIDAASGQDIYLEPGSGRKVEFGGSTFFGENISNWGVSGTDGNIYWDDSTGPNPRFVINTNDPVPADLLLDPQLDVLSEADIIPLTDSTYTIGESARRWLNGYFDDLTVGTGTGFVTSTSGAFGTQATIDISTDTNLAVDSGELTLTGDSLGLATTAVTPGSYTSTDITVDAFGRITAASSGSGASYTFFSPIDESGGNVTFDQTANFVWSGTHTFQNQVYADLDPSDATAVGSTVVINPTLSDDNNAPFWVGNNTVPIFIVTGKTVTAYEALIAEAGASITGGNLNIPGLSDGYLNITSGVVGSTTTITPDLTANYNWTGQHNWLKGIQVTDGATDEYSNFGALPSSPTVSDTVDRLIVSKISDATSGAKRALVAVAEFTGTSNSTSTFNGINSFATTTSGSSGDLTANTLGGGLRNRYVIQHQGSGTVTQASAVSALVTQTGTYTDTADYHAEGFSTGVTTTHSDFWARNSASGTIGTLYGLRLDEHTTGSTNYDIALNGAGGIFFRTPSEAGTAFIRSSSASHLDFGANTHFDFNIGGSEEVNIQANVMTFNNGTNDTSVGWGTDNRLDLTAASVLLSSAIEIDGDLNHDGTNVGLFGVTPVPRPSATTDIKDALTSLGLLQGTSASPLNLDGGALTAGNISSSALVNSRVVYYSSSVLASDSDFTFDGVTTTMLRATVKGGGQSGSSSYRIGGTVFHNMSQNGNAGGSESTLRNETITGNTLAQDGDSLRVHYGGTYAASVNTKQTRVLLGTSVLFDSTALAITAAGAWDLELEIIKTGSGTGKCIGRLNSSSLTTGTATYYTTFSETLSGDLTLSLKGTAASTNDIVYEMSKGTFVATATA